MNADDISRLISDRAQESLYLDFKRGEALERQNNKVRRELIKDVTGLANADGGRLIYGIAEDKVDGIPVAHSLRPVVDAGVDKEWISSIIRDRKSVV